MGLFDIIDHVLWLFMNVSDSTEHNNVQFLQIADLVNEDTPQIYTLCGRGPRSTLRVLRHGLEVRTVFFSFCKFVFPLNTLISYAVPATIQGPWYIFCDDALHGVHGVLSVCRCQRWQCQSCPVTPTLCGQWKDTLTVREPVAAFISSSIHCSSVMLHTVFHLFWRWISGFNLPPHPKANPPNQLTVREKKIHLVK